MTPIVVTNSSPAGRVSRVKAPTPSGGTILASWDNATTAGAFTANNAGAISYPSDGGVNIARFAVTTSGGDNSGFAYLSYNVPSSYMQNGNVLHLAWEMRVPLVTYNAITTNVGPPYQQIKFHLSRAESSPPKWGVQSYRYAVVAMGVASQGASSPNKVRTLNDWFNIAYSPTKDSATLGADTWIKVQLAYREDATNGYVRAWYNGTEVGSESVSNDSVANGGSNNNGGSEGQSLIYTMRFGFAYVATNTTGVPVSMDIRKIVISTAFQSGF